MNKIKVLIVEDEKIAAGNLELMFSEIEPAIEVLAKLESVRDTVKWLRENQVDLIFLDVNLADGLSFKIFEQLKVKTPVIFTTAYDEYAIKAFKLNSVDYLLKPLDKKEIAASISKFKELRFQPSGNDKIDQLLEALQKKQEYQKRFIVYSGEKIKTIDVKDIAYFFVQNEDVYLCSKEGRNYPVDYTLDHLEEILEPDFFFRINRQFIIHIDSIENMYLLSKSRIKLILKPLPEAETIVSLSRTGNFRQWLNR